MPTRVVHVITRMILGGAQENTLLTCEGLHASEEWDVTLVTGPALGPEGELVRRAVDGGIDTILIPPLRRALNPWRDAVSLVRLYRIFRRLKPRIVHTHSSKAGVLGRIAARLARVPVIVHTVHGLPFHPYQSATARFLYVHSERIAARCCHRILTVADAMTRQALAAGVGQEGLYRTVYSGMDVAPLLESGVHRDEVRARYAFDEKDVVIGKIARLFDLKGHEFVIRAAPEIVRRCPQAKFLFVGDGILQDDLRRLTEQLGVADRFVFAGLVPPGEIPAMISAMDVVVHASLREGLARVLVQALLCAKPTVSYDVDGAPEVIIDGVTGRLIAPKSVDELAQAVIDLVEHPDEAARMAEEGRRRFTDQFRTETMVADIEETYRELLAALPSR